MGVSMTTSGGPAARRGAAVSRTRRHQRFIGVATISF
jgi:hypothetical protein